MTNLTTTQAGAQITRDDYHWGTTLGVAQGPINFGFRTSAPGYSVSGENVQGTFTAFSAAEQTAARAALALWASVADITFTDLGNSNGATIEFANYRSSTDQSEAFAFLPVPPADTSSGSSMGDVFVNTYYASTTNDSPGTYEFLTFIHEIGHALGLEHPGNYNAGPGQTITYANSAEYVEDTRMYTLMSYFDETNSGGHFSVYNESPMLADIAAIQRLYGANMTTRTGDSIYGFNSNVGSVFAIASASQHVVYTIWDAGGNDTLDFSGYSQNQTIDMNAEHFSSVGGDTYNVSIALGVTVEKAFGGAGADTIIGNPSDNIIDGGVGADTMIGGIGNDTYYVDNTGDIVTESSNQGIDSVHASISYSLIANVENLYLQGSGNIAATGNALDNVLQGTAGNNVLNGGTGADTMTGGAGSDAYFVDNAGDTIIENANEGSDAVYTTISYALPANVEHIYLQGTDNLSAVGNSLSNYMQGNSGNNVFYGGGGNDVMQGGAGSDAYFVDSTSDSIIENANEGGDAVYTTVSYTLAANVEHLYLQGTSDLNGTGNALSNYMLGNSGNNIINGGAGSDVLQGGGGNDTFVFNVGEANNDQIYDFDGMGAAAGDMLRFVGYGPGSSLVNVNATIWQIDYNGGADHEIIILTNAATLHASDFSFV